MGVKEEYGIKNEELRKFASNNLSFKITEKYLEKDYLNCYFLLIFRNLVKSYNKLIDKYEIGEAVNKIKEFVIYDNDYVTEDELTKKFVESGISGDNKKNDFGNDYLEILKLIPEKSSHQIGLTLFKYLLIL